MVVIFEEDFCLHTQLVKLRNFDFLYMENIQDIMGMEGSFNLTSYYITPLLY